MFTFEKSETETETETESLDEIKRRSASAATLRQLSTTNSSNTTNFTSDFRERVFTPSELYDIKQKFRRELDKCNLKELEMISKIIDNILHDSENVKFRKIAHRRVSDRVSNFLLSLEFVSKVVDFEMKYVFEGSQRAFSKILIGSDSVKAVISNLKKAEQEKMNEVKKYQEEQERKKNLLETIKLEMISRQKGF